MADVLFNEEYIKVVGADTPRLLLGNANNEMVSTFVVQLVTTTPVGVVAVVQARSAATPPPAAAAFVPWVYRSAYLNGAAVTTFALVATTVTTDSILHIPASGLQIAINISGHTSGTLEFYIKRLQGAPTY